MLILLPPSEGKTAPRRGRALDLTELAFPELAEARTAMLDALVAVSGSPGALEALRVGESLADSVHANVGLWDAPTAPAASVYSGVLFDALGYATLDAAAKRRAKASVLVFSALFGVVALGDRIPAYRLGGAAALPGVGTPASFWRRHLDGVVAPDRLIVDCRSSTYAPMWTPPGALAVRVFKEQAGRRTVVSHMAKHSRGLVARALVSAHRVPRNAQTAAETASQWFASQEVRTATGALVRTRVELTPDSLDVITD